jgi:hypothetical protein
MPFGKQASGSNPNDCRLVLASRFGGWQVRADDSPSTRGMRDEQVRESRKVFNATHHSFNYSCTDWSRFTSDVGCTGSHRHSRGLLLESSVAGTMSSRITPITQSGTPCDDCVMSSWNFETDAVVRVVMRTEENPRHLTRNLCGNHAEVVQIPDEPTNEQCT